MAEKPEKKDSYDYISGTASVLILSSVLLFGYQAYVWLKNGVWKEIPVWEIIPAKIKTDIFKMEWLGVKNILMWCFDVELVIFLFCVGMVFWLISFAIESME